MQFYENKMDDVATDVGHTPWVTNREQISLPLAFKLHMRAFCSQTAAQYFCFFCFFPLDINV